MCLTPSTPSCTGLLSEGSTLQHQLFKLFYDSYVLFYCYTLQLDDQHSALDPQNIVEGKCCCCCPLQWLTALYPAHPHLMHLTEPSLPHHLSATLPHSTLLSFFQLLSLARRFIFVLWCLRGWLARGKVASWPAAGVLVPWCLALNHCDYLYSRFSCRYSVKFEINFLISPKKKKKTRETRAHNKSQKNDRPSTSISVYATLYINIVSRCQLPQVAQRLIQGILFNFTLSDFVEWARNLVSGMSSRMSIWHVE